EDRARWQQLPEEIAAAANQAAKAREAARQRFDQHPEAIDAEQIRATIPGDGLVLHTPLDGADAALPVAPSDEGAVTWAAGHTADSALEITESATVTIADAGDFERDAAFSVSAWVWLPSDNTAGAIVARMDESQEFRGWDVW